MVRPKILQNLAIEISVVVFSHAEIDDQKVSLMYCVEILSHIIDGISISLFKS